MPPAAVRVGAAVLVAAAAILSHLPALRNGFTFDDPLLVSENTVVSQRQWSRVFLSPYHVGPMQSAPTGLYRPLTILTLAADHAAGGGSPAPFHTTNLLLHAAVAVAVVLGEEFRGRAGIRTVGVVLSGGNVSLDRLPWQ